MKVLLWLTAVEVAVFVTALEWVRVGNDIVLFGAAFAALVYLWRALVRPTIHAVQRAAHVYELIASEDSGFVSRLYRAEGAIDGLRKTVEELLSQSRRLDRIEGMVEEVRRSVGTRAEDPPARL